MRLLAASVLAGSLFAMTSPSFGGDIRTVKVFSSLDAQVFLNTLESFSLNQRNVIANADLMPTGADAAQADASVIPRVLKVPADVVRRNLLSLNTGDLDALLAAASADSNVEPVLSLSLFDDVNINVLPSTIRTLEDGSVSIAGTVQDAPGSVVSLIKKGSDLSGTVQTGTSIFELRPSNPSEPAGAADYLSSKTLFDQVKPVTYLDEPPPETLKIKPPKKDGGLDLNFEPPAGNDPTQPTIVPNVDFIVFFTKESAKQALEKNGQTPSQFAEAAIRLTQQTLDNSQIRQHLVLKKAEEIDYAETGNIILDRDRIQAGSDGLEQVMQRRDATNSDVAVLIVEDSGPYCGIAYIPEDLSLDYSDFAIMVVARTCAMRNHSFPHEYGHLNGARHDRYTDNSGMPMADAHGVIYKISEGKYGRDVMAYPGYCKNVLQIDTDTNCFRQGVWSGQGWTYGELLKSSDDDVDNNSRRTLRLFGPIISAYR